MQACLHQFFVKNGKQIPAANWSDSFLQAGGSVYEVIRIMEGVPLFLEDHLERFFHSANLTGIDIRLSTKEINESIILLITANQIDTGNVMFVCHETSESTAPEFLAWFVPHHYPSEGDYRNGVKLILLHRERENRQAKLLKMDFREAVQKLIREQSAGEALLVDRGGFITEGSKSNFFAIRGNEIFTAPAKDVLSGITRKYVFEICENLKIRLTEKKIHENELDQFEACFITGTSPRILPAASIEGVIFQPEHPILKTLMNEYDSIIRNYVQKGKRSW
jgi:branched-chain amino acid aminotransferase